METRDRRSNGYRAAAGDYVAFRRASNILDLALSAAECADALEIARGEDCAAAQSARRFFDGIRTNLVFCDTGRKMEHLHLGDHDVDWETKHGNCLLEASEILDLLGQAGSSVRNERFRVCISRLRQKVLDGADIGQDRSR